MVSASAAAAIGSASSTAFAPGGQAPDGGAGFSDWLDTAAGSSIVAQLPGIYGPAPMGARTNDAEVRQILGEVLSQYDPRDVTPANLNQALDTLVNYRRSGGGNDINLAAAAHYLSARISVSNGESTPTEEVAKIVGYDAVKGAAQALKRLGLPQAEWLVREDKRHPTSPVSSDVSSWALAGVRDGYRDLKAHPMVPTVPGAGPDGSHI